MANHFIRAGATGANNGTSWTDAWTALPSPGNSAAWVRGDTYYVAGGVYDAFAIDKNESGSATIIVKKANVADNGADPGWDDSYASDVAVFNGRTLLDKGDYVIDGVTGSGESGHGFKFQDLAGAGVGTILISDAQGSVKIRHCEVRNSGYEAPTGINCIWDNGAFTKKGWEITNCWIHDCSKDLISINSLVGTSYADFGCLIERCILSESGIALNDDHGQGIKFQGDCSYLILRQNQMRNNSGTACIAFLGTSGIFDNVMVYDNIFYKTDLETFPTISPGVIYSRDTVTATNFLIANNTIWNMGNPTYPNTVSQFALTGTTSENSLINNIFEESYFTSGGHTGFGVLENNGYFSATGSAAAAVQLGQISSNESGLVSPSTDNFFPVEGGYAVGAGMDLSAYFTTDYDGNQRTNPWDIGALAFLLSDLNITTLNATTLTVG